MKQSSMFESVSVSGEIKVRKYPESAGYQLTDTSHESAKTIKPKDTHQAILKLLESQSLTSDEIATKLNLDRLYIRPRVAELKAQGLIIDTKKRRKNSSGKSAIIWGRT